MQELNAAPSRLTLGCVFRHLVARTALAISYAMAGGVLAMLLLSQGLLGWRDGTYLPLIFLLGGAVVGALRGRAYVQELPWAVSILSLNLLCAGILFPSLLLRSSCRGGNEAAASGGLKTIAVAQVDFRQASPTHGYARSLQELEFTPDAARIQLLDESLASGQKAGYQFHLQATGFTCPQARVLREGEACAGRRVDCLPGSNGRCLVHGQPGAYACWAAEAHPLVYARTGSRSFFLDQAGILRSADLEGNAGHARMPEL